MAKHSVLAENDIAVGGLKAVIVNEEKLSFID